MVKVRPNKGSEGSSRKEIVHGSVVCFIYITYGERESEKKFKMTPRFWGPHKWTRVPFNEMGKS